MRARRSLALGAGIAVLGVAGCGSGSKAPHASASASSTTSTGAHTSTAPLTATSFAVLRALINSSGAKGERFRFNTSEDLPVIGQTAVTGSGAANVSPATASVDATLDADALSELSAVAGGSSELALSLVSRGKSVYVKFPSTLTQLGVGNGKPWLAVDLDSLGSVAQIPEVSSLLSDGTVDPVRYLSQIEAATEGPVTRVGTATVAGVPTTHYRTTLNFSKLNSSLSAKLSKTLAAQLSRAGTGLGGTSVPVNVWIDADNLVRRFSLTPDLDVDGDAIPISLDVTITAYGTQPAPTLPAASETFSLSSLVSQLKGSGISSLFGG